MPVWQWCNLYRPRVIQNDDNGGEKKNKGFRVCEANLAVSTDLPFTKLLCSWLMSAPINAPSLNTRAGTVTKATRPLRAQSPEVFSFFSPSLHYINLFKQKQWVIKSYTRTVLKPDLATHLILLRSLRQYRERQKIQPIKFVCRIIDGKNSLPEILSGGEERQESSHSCHAGACVCVCVCIYIPTVMHFIYFILSAKAIHWQLSL